jgi:hypothetical protein
MSIEIGIQWSLLFRSALLTQTTRLKPLARAILLQLVDRCFTSEEMVEMANLDSQLAAVLMLLRWATGQAALTASSAEHVATACEQ